MILIGQALHDFVKWFDNKKSDEVEIRLLLLEWLKSVGISIKVKRFAVGKKFKYYFATILDRELEMYGISHTIHCYKDNEIVAYRKAIEKANEIYNQRFEK